MPQGKPGTRKHLSHDTRTRDKIRTSQLINRLEKFVLSEEDHGAKVELTRAQVSAALGLIKKTLPDLQAATFDGNLHATFEKLESVIVDPANPGS